MSWNGGPVTGAAPYQPPPQPYPNPQPGYNQQQPYQYGTQPTYGQYQSGPPQRPPDARPPKKKGNPIITRYPPPPGYRGPAQPQGHFGSNQYPHQYQPPQPAYPQAPPPPSTYPSQGFGPPPMNQGYPPQGYGQQQPPNYSQPPYSQGQNYQWPQSGHTPGQGYSQPPGHPPAQGYPGPQSAYQAYPPQPPQVDSNQPAYGHAPGWSPQNPQAPYSQNHQYNPHNPHNGIASNVQPMPDPNATPTPAAASLVTSQPSQVPNQLTGAVSENGSNGKPQLFLAWDDWDFDFDGAIWPKSNEPVDPDLSLGVIVWHPAKQMTRALPSTFIEAEEQALKPTPEKLDNGESVSMYFMPENSHEAFLDVRQTDAWEHIKDDPVFVVFTDEEMHRNMVSLEDCIAQRDRLDDASDEISQDEDQEMQDATWDIMDNLEQALSSGQGTAKSAESKQEVTLSPRQTQEDILAALGVTGLPKPPADPPTPSHPPTPNGNTSTSLPGKPQLISPSTKLPPLPPPPSRAQTYGGHRGHHFGSAPQRAYGSLSSASTARPPPPPPPPEDQRYDPWNAPQQNGHGYDGTRGSPAPSEGSNRTMVGSDFDSEKPSVKPEQERPIIPVLQRSDSSRKRSYEDTDQEGEKQRQQDDQTKRKRRLQVDAAYSRR